MGLSTHREESVDSMLDQVTTRLFEDEFDDLLMAARTGEASIANIDRINMRVIDHGLEQGSNPLRGRPSVLEVDYTVKVLNRNVSHLPLLMVPEQHSLRLLSATGDRGPVNVSEESGKFFATLNGAGIHRIKLMFHFSPLADSNGLLGGITFAFPEAGQAWCQLEMNSPTMKLLESFGDLSRNIVANQYGFTTSSFIQNRSRVKLAWSRGSFQSPLDGGAVIEVQEPGKIFVRYIYKIEKQSLPVVFMVSPLLKIVSVNTCIVKAPDAEEKAAVFSEGNALDFNRCSEHLVIHSFPQSGCFLIGAVVDSRCWKGVGNGRYNVNVPLVTPFDGSFRAYVTHGNGTTLLALDGKLLNSSEQENSLGRAFLEDLNGGSVSAICHSYSKNDCIIPLKVRSMVDSSYVRRSSPVPGGFSVSGFEAEISPSIDGTSFLVREQFRIINMGSTYLPLENVDDDVFFVSAHSRNHRVVPFTLPETKAGSAKALSKEENTGPRESSPQGKSAPGKLRNIAIPFTFSGTPGNAQEGMVDILYIVKNDQGTCPLYGGEYVRTRSKVTLSLLKGWNGSLNSASKDYVCQEFFEPAQTDSADIAESNPSTSRDVSDRKNPRPMDVRRGLSNRDNDKDTKGQIRSRTDIEKSSYPTSLTYILSPVDNIAVGLRSAFSQITDSGSGGSGAGNLSPASKRMLPISSGMEPSSQEWDRVDGVARSINDGHSGSSLIVPVLVVSVEKPAMARVRFNVLFLAFCGLLWSFAISDEKNGTRLFIASTIIMLLALLLGPIDGSILKVLAAATLVSALAKLSIFILEKCSLERDSND